MANIKQQYIQELRKQLLYEFKTGKRGGIYGVIQRNMAYNSNKIEGSMLTERQTANLFETSTINGDDINFRRKDVEEMTGHFRMFNQTLQTLDEPLNINIIKQMHYNLKVDVFEDRSNGYPCGEFKNRENFISNIKTALPEDVPARMEELIKNYNQIQTPTVKDLAMFHSAYENIHPFQDGNGRTSRMILFRESLRHGMIPLIIQDKNKNKYYQCLNDARTKNFRNMTEYFEEEQNAFYEETKGVVLPYDVIKQDNLKKEQTENLTKDIDMSNPDNEIKFE